MTNPRTRLLPVLLSCLAWLACSHDGATPATDASPPGPTVRFSVVFPASLSANAIDGRVLVVLATGDKEPPRKQVSDLDTTAQVFGIDANRMEPDKPIVLDASALGYPVASLSAVPAGDYYVEAVLHRYEWFRRSDGHEIKLPPDRGEGQDWTSAPGNLVSAPRKIHVDPAAGLDERLELSQALPAIETPPDTPYVKHVRMQSALLTKFWGRPTFLGAIVLLPEGFDAHPDAHYPVVIAHGHFDKDFWAWREKPADDGLPPVDLANLRVHCPNGHEKTDCDRYGYERLKQETEYASFQKWTGPGFPRVLAVQIQHANPYYDDSYAVNSENIGPYGDAITYELIPYLEKTFRGLGPWARALIGGSTGGWEALGAQIFYPEQYNGAVANCPDPIDFRAYMTVDIYQDQNAYYDVGPFRRTARPSSRDYLGRTRSTIEEDNLKELVLGTSGRSGGQWDVWQAVFSPVGGDGYPFPIWDKRTGRINPQVAAYWKEHYDLGHILARDWPRLAPNLRGKITINVGLSDNYFLNDAVYLVDDFLKSANPPADAVVDYGPRDEHCWSGDHTTFNGVSRLTYLQRYLPKFVEHWLKTAPKGADVKSWKY